MKAKISHNLNNLAMSLGMFAYGLSLIFMKTEIRIAEPPLRYAIIIGCLLIPILIVYAIFQDRPTLKKWGLIFMGSLWFIVAYLYTIAPVYNAGMFPLATLGLVTWTSLSRGDYQ